MELMKLEIITPNGVIFDDEVKQVTLPGSEGEFGVLSGHATLITILDAGVLVIDSKKGKELQVAINGGYVKVEEKKTLCMVDGAVCLSGDDTNLAKALADAKELLEKSQSRSTTIAAAISKVEQINKR